MVICRRGRVNGGGRGMKMVHYLSILHIHRSEREQNPHLHTWDYTHDTGNNLIGKGADIAPWGEAKPLKIREEWGEGGDKRKVNNVRKT